MKEDASFHGSAYWKGEPIVLIAYEEDRWFQIFANEIRRQGEKSTMEPDLSFAAQLADAAIRAMRKRDDRFANNRCRTLDCGGMQCILVANHKGTHHF